MKYITYIISSVTFVIIVEGCATQPVFYHSEASLPYFHRSTKTVFQLIKDDGIANDFQFGIIAAKDNDTLSYIILAPSKQQKYYVKNLTDVDLNRAIPIQITQVKELIDIIDASIEKWDEKFNSIEGISYEFIIAPEHKVIQQSQNVTTWYPRFIYYFHNNKNGPIVSIIFGEDLMQYYYRIQELSAIKDLSNLLRLAIKR